MICSFTISLKPLEFGKKILKYNLDKDIFSIFLEEGVTKEELKNLSISNFLTKDKFIGERNYSIRISSISSEVTLKILKILFFKRMYNEKVIIYETEFLISNVYHNNRYSDQFDLESFLELPLYQEVSINFLTPTFFKFGDRFFEELKIEYFFKNISTKLKRSSLNDKSLVKENIDFKNIILKKISLKKIDVKTFKTNGFVGEVHFIFNEYNEEKLRFLNILVYFSKFSCVGYGCEKGFGQVEISFMK